jgi:hypothetical protein
VTAAGNEADGLITAGGPDSLATHHAPPAEVATLRLSTGGGTDAVVINAPAATTPVDLGGGDATAQLQATTANASLTLTAGSGSDFIDIIRSGSGATIDASGNDDPDIVRVAGANLPPDAVTMIHGDTSS